MLTERELRDKFWEFYKARAKGGYAFEVSMETASRKADLITIEVYQDLFQINAFEFKLTDYNKVKEQAAQNVKYSNKSWIVMPASKSDFLKNHAHELRNLGIGAMTVEDGGRWNMIVQAPFHKECNINQEILKIAELNPYSRKSAY